MIIAIIPVKTFENSKSRLSDMLSLPERVQLSELMLEDTLHALCSSKQISEIVVVSADGRAGNYADKYRATFLAQSKDAGVNSAVAVADRYALKKNAIATIVIPQDLPLLYSDDIDEICKSAKGNNMVICPSLRFDGTNILLRSPPCVISTSYDNNSYEAHIKLAEEANASVFIDSHHDRLMFDIDTPQDAQRLAEMDENKINAKKVSSFLKMKVSLGNLS